MLGERAMEIFVRLFLWILKYTYGRRGGSTLYGPSALDEVLLSEHEKEREEKRKDHIVEEFRSSAEPAPGAVDYGELSWASFTSVIETPEQFTFYSGRNIAKVIAKRELSDARQLAALRRVIRRNVANSELSDD